jgi:hypothetical protein
MVPGVAIVRRFLWGVLALCVVALFIAAVVSVTEDLRTPDSSLSSGGVGDCVGFADDGRDAEDPGAARIVGCDDSTARYRVLGDGNLSRQLNGGDACSAFPDTVRALVIGPEAPTFGRIVCLGTADRRPG